MHACVRELYLKMTSSSESFNILQLIANDCYRVPYALTYIYVYMLPHIQYIHSYTPCANTVLALGNLEMIVYHTHSHVHCMI